MKQYNLSIMPDILWSITMPWTGYFIQRIMTAAHTIIMSIITRTTTSTFAAQISIKGPEFIVK